MTIILDLIGREFMINVIDEALDQPSTFDDASPTLSLKMVVHTDFKILVNVVKKNRERLGTQVVIQGKWGGLSKAPTARSSESRQDPSNPFTSFFQK